MRAKLVAKRNIKRGEAIAPSPLLVATEFSFSGVKLNARNQVANGSASDFFRNARLHMAGLCAALQWFAIRIHILIASCLGVFLALGHETLERGAGELLAVLANRVRLT